MMTRRFLIAALTAAFLASVPTSLRGGESQGAARTLASKAMPWLKKIGPKALEIVVEATVGAVIQEKIVSYWGTKTPAEPPQRLGPGSETSRKSRGDRELKEPPQEQTATVESPLKRPPLRREAGTTFLNPIKPIEKSPDDVFVEGLKRLQVPRTAPPDPVEAFRRGYSYDSGRDGRRDPVQAEQWYRQAAEQGHVVAQYYLAQLYFLGDSGISRDPGRAVYWLTAAAERGFAIAQTQLASAYENGDSVRLDLQAAAFWYGEAARQAEPHAQYRLAALYYEGEGVKRNFVREFDWLNLAVDQDYPPAIRMMDRRLDDHFEDARSGHRGAQHLVGIAFEDGVRGLLRRDYDAAAYWFDRAARNGSESARRALIALCEDRLIRCR